MFHYSVCQQMLATTLKALYMRGLPRTQCPLGCSHTGQAHGRSNITSVEYDISFQVNSSFIGRYGTIFVDGITIGYI